MLDERVDVTALMKIRCDATRNICLLQYVLHRWSRDALDMRDVYMLVAIVIVGDAASDMLREQAIRVKTMPILC